MMLDMVSILTESFHAYMGLLFYSYGLLLMVNHSAVELKLA